MQKDRKKPNLMTSFSVEDRVHSAIAVLRSNDPNRRIAITELCRAAGVNRANLYANHPELLAQLNERPKKIIVSCTQSIRQAEKRLSELVSSQTEIITSLRYACLELYMELHRVRQQMVEMERGAKEKRSRKRF